MTLSMTVPANVARGIEQRLQQIEDIKTTIGLMVQIAAEFQGHTGPITLLGVQGDTLLIETPEVHDGDPA
jgi:hypothetical protein